MQRFLDPRNDFAFKHVFGSEQYKDITIDFLNSVLHLEGDKRIDSIEFLNPSQAPLYAGHKISMVDISCRDQRGLSYIIEMQMARTAGFLERIQYYGAKTYVSQLGSAQEYQTLRQVIVLAILDHIAFPKTVDFESLHTMRNTKTDECILDAFTFKFIELPKFNKTWGQVKTLEEGWLYFFKNAGKDNEIAHDIQGTPLAKAYSALERYNFNEKQMNAYEDAALALVDFKNTSQVMYEEGLEEGVKKGTHEIALNMLSKGLPDDMILEITKITTQELDELKKQH